MHVSQRKAMNNLELCLIRSPVTGGEEVLIGQHFLQGAGSLWLNRASCCGNSVNTRKLLTTKLLSAYELVLRTSAASFGAAVLDAIFSRAKPGQTRKLQGPCCLVKHSSGNWRVALDGTSTFHAKPYQNPTMEIRCGLEYRNVSYSELCGSSQKQEVLIQSPKS